MTGGLYNMVLGDGHEVERGSLILSILGLNQGVPRYRDSWAEIDENGTPRFAIYTRVGGGNREDYEEQIAYLQSNPFYLLDRDDDFDETYATFYFRMPAPQELIDADLLDEKDRDAYVDSIKKITELAYPEPQDMSELWKKAINALKEVR